MGTQISRRAFLRSTVGFAAAAAVLPLLNACGQSTSTPTPAAASGAAGTPATSAGAGVQMTFLNQSRGQVAALGTLVETYAATTGVKVTVDTPGPADFPAKLQASSQAGNMPDLYSAIGQADMAPYYKAGWAMNLTQELEQGWNKSFPASILKTLTWAQGNTAGVPAGIYSVPWEVTSYAILANPAHFQKAGLDLATPPATAADLVDQFKKIKAAGVAPFQIAASFTPNLAQAHASNWLTDDEINDTMAGKASWKADGWRKALQLLVDLRDAGAIANNALPAGASDNPDVEKEFFNVRALAAFFDGSFGVGVQRTTAPDFTTYMSFPLPKAADGKISPRAVGGAGKAGVVNPKGKQAAEALKFLKWLTEPAQEQVFMDKVPLIPANPAALDPQKVSPQVAGFAALVDKLQVVPTPMSKQVNEALVKGAQSLVLKERTVDQILDDLDAAQKSS
jgi:ABC-type glycerol-3-phosphate transport system substrate-binding protein